MLDALRLERGKNENVLEKAAVDVLVNQACALLDCMQADTTDFQKHVRSSASNARVRE